MFDLTASAADAMQRTLPTQQQQEYKTRWDKTIPTASAAATSHSQKAKRSLGSG